MVWRILKISNFLDFFRSLGVGFYVVLIRSSNWLSGKGRYRGLQLLVCNLESSDRTLQPRLQHGQLNSCTGSRLWWLIEPARTTKRVLFNIVSLISSTVSVRWLDGGFFLSWLLKLVIQSVPETDGLLKGYVWGNKMKQKRSYKLHKIKRWLYIESNWFSRILLLPSTSSISQPNIELWCWP